MHQCIKYILLE